VLLGWDELFYFLMLSKFLLVIISVIFLRKLKRMSCDKYNSWIFGWLIFSIIIFFVMIATRPSGFYFHLLTVTTLIMVIWLVIPQKSSLKLLFALAATIIEVGITIINNPITSTTVFTIMLNFILANIMVFLAQN
jgi:hypothetical protein